MKKITNALLVLCMVGLLTGCDKGTYDEVKGLVEEEKYEEAIKILDTIKVEPKTEDQISICYYKIGEMAMEDKKWEIANSCFSESQEEGAEKKAEKCFKIIKKKSDLNTALVKSLEDRIENYNLEEPSEKSLNREIEAVQPFVEIDFTPWGERYQELLDDYYKGVGKQGQGILETDNGRVYAGTRISWIEGEIEKHQAILSLKDEFDFGIHSRLITDEYSQERIDELKQYLEDLQVLTNDAILQLKVSNVEKSYGIPCIVYKNNTAIDCDVKMYIEFFDENSIPLGEAKVAGKDGIKAGSTELLGFLVPQRTEIMGMAFDIKPSYN